MNSEKTISEESLNKHAFVATNWRPIDCIYWITNRSVRKKKLVVIFKMDLHFMKTH